MSRKSLNINGKLKTSRVDTPTFQCRKPLRIWVNGKEAYAFDGETVAAALLAQGIRQFRLTHKEHAPRGVYCGMGVCFECMVRVDGNPNVQACLTPLVEGMRIETES